MGIVITSNFDMNSALPLDSRFVVADNTARDAITSGRRFQGLLVFVTATGKTWQLRGGITNSDWKEFGAGGGGGGGGANWQPVLGSGPIESYEFNEKVWLYSVGITQTLELWVKVPTSYSSGSPVTFTGLFYSNLASNNWAVFLRTYLIRKNTDAITSTTNSATVTSADFTNTVANQIREVSLTIAAAGTINSVSISAGDILRLQLSRTPPSAGTDFASDLRFIPSSTEILFA